MIIKRGGIAQPISGKVGMRELPVYCPACTAAAGLPCNDKTRLQVRVWLPHETIDTTIEWLQCPLCWTPIAKQDVARPAQLTTRIEKKFSKYDVPIEPIEHSEMKDALKKQRGFNPRVLQEREEQSEIKDQDLRREMRSGAIKIINYTET